MFKNSKPSQIIWRILFYLAGMLIIAFGVAFSVNSSLGVSPVTSFPYAIHMSLVSHGFTALTLGNCVIIVYLAYIAAQIIILGKSFKPINLFQILISTGFGYFVDFAKWVLGDFIIPTYFGRLLMLLISIMLIGLGLSFYLGAKLLPMPFEGLGLVITEKLGKYPYPKVKIVMDCASVVLAVLTGLIFTGRVAGVREGTLITALLAGHALGLFARFINPLITRMCFEKNDKAAG